MVDRTGKTQVGYTRLGKSGLKVSKLILGMMSYGDKEWSEWVIDDQEECNKHVRTAFEHGVNTLDTANMYSQGLSEVMTGKAIKAVGVPREEWVILTKVHMPVKAGVLGGPRPPTTADEQDTAGFVNQRGLSRKHILDSVDASLKRLDTDYIDVLQCHRFDYETPIEETMQALHDVVQSGKVRYVGMSSCYAHQFWQMQTYAIQNRLTPFISMQNFVNAVYREEEREMIPTLKHFGVGVIPWSPIARGFLARPIGQESTTRASSDAVMKRFVDTESPASIEINKRIEKTAKDLGKSMAQVAYAWASAQEYITAPIFGSTKHEHLVEAIESTQIKLSEEQIAYINEPYVPMVIKGHA